MRERPNRDALNRAVDIFRDAMRAFVVRHMRRVFGDGAEEAIHGSLSGGRSDDFMWSLRKGRSVEDAVDVNDFPHIVRENWTKVFRIAFDGDRAVRGTLEQIADARNQAVHPGTEDLELEYVRSRLYDVADVLGRIGAEEEKREVEGVRDRLRPPGIPSQLPTHEGGYGVYEEKIYNYARVHRETCTYWQGRKRGPINVHENEWHGPFGSREEAFGRAGETGRDVVGCKVCRP